MNYIYYNTFNSFFKYLSSAFSYVGITIPSFNILSLESLEFNGLLAALANSSLVTGFTLQGI